MNLSSKQVVALVAGAATAGLLAPPSVHAVTTTLATIVDPGDAGRRAHVGAAGALHVETRAGVVSGAFYLADNSNTTLNLRPLRTVEYPYRLAITEFTAGARGQDNGNATDIELRAYVRTSGTGACGSAGWQAKSLRRFMVMTNTTEQLQFDGPPLVLPAPAAGQAVCFAYVSRQLPTGVTVHAGATGYVYR